MKMDEFTHPTIDVPSRYLPTILLSRRDWINVLPEDFWILPCNVGNKENILQSQMCQTFITSMKTLIPLTLENKGTAATLARSRHVRRRLVKSWVMRVQEFCPSWRWSTQFTMSGNNSSGKRSNEDIAGLHTGLLIRMSTESKGRLLALGAVNR